MRRNTIDSGGMRLGTGWALVAGVAFALALVACAAVSTGTRAESARETSAATAAATAEDAVRLVVEGTGAVYAGDCAATRSPDDVGKVCSKLMDEHNGIRAYLTGRTFSEFSLWVFVEQTPTGWASAGTAPLDFFAATVTIPWPR